MKRAYGLNHGRPGESKPEKQPRPAAQRAASESAVNRRARNSTLNRKVKISLAPVNIPEVNADG